MADDVLSNQEAEAFVLGAVLISPGCLGKVIDILRPEYFSLGVHGRIYQRILDIDAKGGRPDVTTVKGSFADDPALTEHGGAEYVLQVARFALHTEITGYAETIRDLYMRRQTRAILTEAIGAIQHLDDITADMHIQSIEHDLYQLTEGKPDAAGLVDLHQVAADHLAAVERAMKNPGAITGQPTGLVDLDRALKGLHRGSLVILGGRPAMGKSALAGCLARAVAKARKASGERVVIFSQEMQAEEWQGRWAAADTGISYDRQRSGDLGYTPDQRRDAFVNLDAAMRGILDLPIEIVDRGGVGTPLIRSICRRVARQHGLALVVIDHLQLMSQPGRHRDRRLEIGEITRELKKLAKELDVPILLLSQLSRALESREDKRPRLADLKEAGEIEQDADVVMFCYRHEYYLDQEEPVKKTGEKDADFNTRYSDWRTRLSEAENIAEILIRKNRQGTTSDIKLHWDGARALFTDLARD